MVREECLLVVLGSAWDQGEPHRCHGGRGSSFALRLDDSTKSLLIVYSMETYKCCFPTLLEVASLAVSASGGRLRCCGSGSVHCLYFVDVLLSVWIQRLRWDFFFLAPLRTSLNFFRNFKYLSVTGKQECDVNLKQNITLLIKA